MTKVPKGLFFLLLPLSLWGEIYFEYPCYEECCECKGQWIGGIDLIVFNAHQENLPYSYSFQLDEFIGTPYDFVVDNQFYSGNILFSENNLDFHYSPGFRVALGYHFCDSNYVQLNRWTHLHGTAKDCLGSFTIGDFVQPTNFLNEDGFDVNSFDNQSTLYSACAHWGLSWDQVDLMLMKRFCIAPTVMLNPSIGISYLHLKQKFRSFVPSTNPFFDTTISDVVTNQIDQSYRYEAFGVGAGLETQWKLFTDLYLFGEGRAELFWGEFDVKRSQNEVFLDSLALHSTLHDRFHDSRFASYLALGLMWESSLNCDKNQVAAKLAWENHLFWQQNLFAPIGNGQNIQTKPQTVDGDLSLSGFIVSLVVSY